MNARIDMIPATDKPNYLFACANGVRVSWLARALGTEGNLVAVSADSGAIDERIATLAPLVVFLDFSPDYSANAIALHQRLKRDWPNVPVLAVGLTSEANSVLTALRAGMDDFVDLNGPPEEALKTLRGLLDRRDDFKGGPRGCTLAILGARAGLGVTTLAASLALTLQYQHTRDQKTVPGRTQRSGVALLDLGLPARDGILYLDTPSTFSFIDGVRNLRRLDQTLLHTALTHHSSGVAVLPLPTSLQEVREVSHAESVSLIKRLGDFFDYQIADLGAFSSADFIVEAASAADQVWIVCDQSIGGIVSTAGLIKDLRARGVATGRFGLVVNKFDSRVSLSARDISVRLEVPLRLTIPMRSTQLLDAASRGEMLVRIARGDPYSEAVLAAARALQQDVKAAAGQQEPNPYAVRKERWPALMAQLTNSWKKGKE